MGSTLPTVIILDDDQTALESLGTLLASAGFEVQTTATLDELLACVEQQRADCLLVDYRLGNYTAVDVLERVQQLEAAPPVIVITGAGDVRTAVQAMRAGAADFFTKPLDHEELIHRLWRAVEESQAAREEQQELAEIRARLDSLTPREREILDRVIDGKVTKEIAAELGISPKTVEVHRSHVTRKMMVRSIAELVRMVTKYELSRASDSERQD